MKTHWSSQWGVSADAMLSTNEDYKGVGFAHSTDEESNDSGRKG